MNSVNSAQGMNLSPDALASSVPFDHPLLLVIIFAGVSLLPMIFMAASSFVKISVVLNIFRNAVGAGQIPSGPIVGVVAIALTMHVMTPIGKEMLHELETSEMITGIASKLPSKTLDGKNISERDRQSTILAQISSYVAVAGRTSKPLVRFLRKHAHLKEREFFSDYNSAHSQAEESSATAASSSSSSAEDLPNCAELSNGNEKTGPNCNYPGETLGTLTSAFLISELKEAFLIGFAIYLPFLVIDLVIANILVAMGMSMVNPVTIALPFKLILFVITDGWFLLSRGLVLSYQ